MCVSLTIVGMRCVYPFIVVGVRCVCPFTVVGVRYVYPFTAVGVRCVCPITAVGVRCRIFQEDSMWALGSTKDSGHIWGHL